MHDLFGFIGQPTSPPPPPPPPIPAYATPSIAIAGSQIVWLFSPSKITNIGSFLGLNAGSADPNSWQFQDRGDPWVELSNVVTFYPGDPWNIVAAQVADWAFDGGETIVDQSGTLPALPPSNLVDDGDALTPSSSFTINLDSYLGQTFGDTTGWSLTTSTGASIISVTGNIYDTFVTVNTDVALDGGDVITYDGSGTAPINSGSIVVNLLKVNMLDDGAAAGPSDSFTINLDGSLPIAFSDAGTGWSIALGSGGGVNSVSGNIGDTFITVSCDAVQPSGARLNYDGSALNVPLTANTINIS